MGATQDLVAAARAARQILDDAVDAPPPAGSVEECATLVGELQALANVATALQDTAIVALAAVETEVDEDGALVECRRTPGHVALDAPAIVSGVLCVSTVHAESRVHAAVRRAADGSDGTDTHTGLGGLHAAMSAGRLDAYRAQVVAHELEEVPAEVAGTVIATVDHHFDDEAAPALRRRVRRALARISPDLLRQRAVRARAESSLQRWVDEPGVDTWHGTFPSEEACAAWAAIDALAQQYVSDAVCDRIDRARAKALTDLVTRQATIDVRVTVATPAAPAESAAPVVAPPSAAGAPTDLVEATGLRPGDPVLVPRGWLDRGRRAQRRRRRPRALSAPALRPGQRRPCRPRRLPHHHVLPTRFPARRLRPTPRPALPLPRLPRRRAVLRPRPRRPLPRRADQRREPRLPLPSAPPHQAAPRLAGGPPSGRLDDLDRPHRAHPHHRPTRPAPPRRAARHRNRRGPPTPRPALARPARGSPLRPRAPPRAPRRRRRRRAASTSSGRPCR